jgi:hypothetical protein
MCTYSRCDHKLCLHHVVEIQRHCAASYGSFYNQLCSFSAQLPLTTFYTYNTCIRDKDAEIHERPLLLDKMVRMKDGEESSTKAELDYM